MGSPWSKTREQVLATLHAAYEREFAACDALLALSDQMLVRHEFDWKRPGDRILTLEVARSAKTYMAGLELCHAGFGPQAAMLARSLFESMLISHWVTDHRDVAEDRWLRHARFLQFLNAESLARPGHPDADPAASRVARRSNAAAPRILIRSIAPIRAHGADLGQVWKRAVYRGVSKPAVAEELWPILERKLRQAIAAGDISNVPLGRVLARVAELASLPRHGWALQTREP